MGLMDNISKSSFSRPSGRLASRLFVRLCLKGLQDSPQNSCRFSSFDYNIGPPVGESFKYPKERMNDEFTMSNVIDVIVTRHMTMLRRYFEPELLFRRTLPLCPRTMRSDSFGDGGCEAMSGHGARTILSLEATATGKSLGLGKAVELVPSSDGRRYLVRMARGPGRVPCAHLGKQSAEWKATSP